MEFGGAMPPTIHAYTDPQLELDVQGRHWWWKDVVRGTFHQLQPDSKSKRLKH